MQQAQPIQNRQYAFTIVQAPKGARRILIVLLQGLVPPTDVRNENMTFYVNTTPDTAKKLLVEIRKLYTREQVTFSPDPETGAVQHPPQIDPVTGAVSHTVRPISPAMTPQKTTEGFTVVDIPENAYQQLEGVAVAWPYEVTRVEDLNKLETIAKERRKFKDGKKIVRLGVHGERTYLFEPVRDQHDGDNKMWRAWANLSDGSRKRVGAAEEWAQAVACVYAYETKLSNAPVVEAVPEAPTVVERVLQPGTVRVAVDLPKPEEALTLPPRVVDFKELVESVAKDVQASVAEPVPSQVHAEYTQRVLP